MSCRFLTISHTFRQRPMLAYLGLPCPVWTELLNCLYQAYYKNWSCSGNNGGSKGAKPLSSNFIGGRQRFSTYLILYPANLYRNWVLAADCLQNNSIEFCTEKTPSPV